MAGRTGARLILSLVVFCLVAELFGLAAYYVDTGALFYLHRKTYPELLPAPQDRLVVGEALHPYFGPTHRPGTPFDIPASLREGTAVPERMTTNNFGFVSPHDYPFAKTSEDQVILGMFGGSVGAWFCQIGAPRLVDQLRANPYFKDREIVPLCFAHEGYKQPQQALVLAYFLSIGQAYDLVVNIDGFNDVALAALNNEQGLDISMPSVQHLDPLIALVNRSALTPEKLESLAAIFRDRQTLMDLAGRIAANRSAAVNVVLDWYYAPRVGAVQPGARTVQQPAGEPARECADPGHAVDAGARRSGGLLRHRRAVVRRIAADGSDGGGERRGLLPLSAAEPVLHDAAVRFRGSRDRDQRGVALQDQY